MPTVATPQSTDKSVQPPTAALATTPKCPSCGREGVVVFQVLRAADGSAPKDRKPVCLGCCPELDGHS